MQVLPVAASLGNITNSYNLLGIRSNSYESEVILKIPRESYEFIRIIIAHWKAILFYSNVLVIHSKTGWRIS